MSVGIVDRTKRKSFRYIRELFYFVAVIIGSLALTLVFFLVLPFMQKINKPPTTDLMLQTMDTAKLEAPDPPPEPEPEEEPEEEPPPPKLAEEAPPLDLSQLALALNPGISGGWMEGDFAIKFNTVVEKENDVDTLFSIAELDQKPRLIYSSNPALNKKMKDARPGKVIVIFIVDQQGKVVNPKVQSSSNPIFEKATLMAIKRWKFEPGKHGGKAVSSRMRVPIVF